MHSFAFENDESQVALSFCCRAHSLIFGCVFVWRPYVDAAAGCALCMRTVSNRSQMKMERPPCLTQNGVDACGQTVDMLCRRTFMLLVNLQDRFACFAIGSRKCKMVKECVFFPLLFRKTNGRSCPSS